MAYRRRQGFQRDSMFREEEAATPPLPLYDSSSISSSTSSASSLAAKAIKASSAYRDPSLSSAYGHSGFPSPRDSHLSTPSSNSSSKDRTTYGYTSMKSLNEPKQGFWGVLAGKAKAILEDDSADRQNETPGPTREQIFESRTPVQVVNDNSYKSSESHSKIESPTLRKGLDAIASSFNHIGCTIGNALEEGFTIVENRTADIIQETRKFQIKKKFCSELQNQASKVNSTCKPPQMHAHVQIQMRTDFETQLKASRDVRWQLCNTDLRKTFSYLLSVLFIFLSALILKVQERKTYWCCRKLCLIHSFNVAMAMSAKAKLLLRELKTVKADLAFAKERCAQLEEENRVLRESHEKGDGPEDDDLIRLQLETLLAEKARLAQENSVLTRENRFLREVVEYHQLTMQDVVYLDEGTEEVTEVYPIGVPLTPTKSQALHPLSSLVSAVPDSTNSQVDVLHSESSSKAGEN